MTSTPEQAGDGHAAFLTKDDEVGLATAMAAQTGESVPDTLEVHSDAMSVLQESTDSMRAPVRKIAMVVGIVLVVMVAGGILSRVVRGRSTPPVQ